MTDFMSPEALTAALPEVLAAPRDRGAVRLLCLRPKPNQRSFPGRLTLTRAVGVVGDFEASRPWQPRSAQSGQHHVGAGAGSGLA
jgi:hypothetical protein